MATNDLPIDYQCTIAFNQNFNNHDRYKLVNTKALFYIGKTLTIKGVSQALLDDVIRHFSNPFEFPN